MSVNKPCPISLGAHDAFIDVSVIIVNWNTADLLQTCLTSVMQQHTSLRTEIIVIDNGSNDHTAQMMAQKFGQVRLLANDRNKGFAAATNQGFGHARGRYILLLNTDTVVLPNALDTMVRYLDTRPSVGALGPRLLNEDGSLQISVYPFPRVFHDSLVILEINRWPLIRALARWYGRRRDDRLTAEPGEVDWVTGACLLLRRQALDEVGVLNETYFFGTEEMDLCYRLRKQGWRTSYLPTAEVIHFGGRSRQHISARHVIWLYTGRLHYYRLHQARWHYHVLRGAVALSAFGHIVKLLPGLRSPIVRPLLSAYARVLARAIAS